MRKFAVVISSAFLAMALSSAAFGARYHGEIMDSACAKNGGHAEMMKKAGINPKAADAKADCSNACVKMGSKYVLYNRTTKRTYKLDDQTKPEAFAGKDVVVTGVLNRSTGTIHVENIAAMK